MALPENTSCKNLLEIFQQKTKLRKTKIKLSEIDANPLCKTNQIVYLAEFYNFPQLLKKLLRCNFFIYKYKIPQKSKVYFVNCY